MPVPVAGVIALARSAASGCRRRVSRRASCSMVAAERLPVAAFRRSRRSRQAASRVHHRPRPAPRLRLGMGKPGQLALAPVRLGASATCGACRLYSPREMLITAIVGAGRSCARARPRRRRRGDGAHRGGEAARPGARPPSLRIGMSRRPGALGAMRGKCPSSRREIGDVRPATGAGILSIRPANASVAGIGDRRWPVVRP